MTGDAAIVLKGHFDAALRAWRGGLKRGGGGRVLADYLAMQDMSEQWRSDRKDSDDSRSAA